MTATPILSDQPVVSVIVPARNEEACLGACLQSLVSQKTASGGIAVEIIVVDDHSTDRTREIASSFSADQGRLNKVHLIDAPALPAGWTGKNNALIAGFKIARGQWLLFTDADTIHHEGSLVRAVDEATRRGAALLSYSPEQIVKTFAEKAAMPVIFAELAATYSPSKISNPKSPAAAANGQYTLITREAYDAVGGHAAIASDLLDDVALARAVKRSGRKIFFRYGADAVRTRMYHSFAHLREGWTKNLSLLFPSPIRLAALRAIEFVLVVFSFAIAAAGLMRQQRLQAAFATMLCLILYSLFIQRIRRANFSWDANLLALFGLPLFSYFLLRSRLFHQRDSVTWKGRSYSSKGTGAAQFPRALGSKSTDSTATQSAPQKRFLPRTDN